MDPRLHFERFEFKYFVPDERSKEMAAFLSPYLKPDHFGEPLPGGAYLTTNLYFDSPSLSFYWAHAGSAVDRFKLRVRTYGAGPVCFFEIKRKIRDVIVKHRCSVAREHFLAVLAGDLEPASVTRRPEILEEFISLMVLHGAVPQYLIRYQREAFENRLEEDARVTFDRRLAYQRVESLDLVGDPLAWTYLDSSVGFRGLDRGTLLELKFNSFAPLWLDDFVKSFGLRRVQFSKYLTTVEHHQLRRREPIDALPRSRLALR